MGQPFIMYVLTAVLLGDKLEGGLDEAKPGEDWEEAVTLCNHKVRAKLGEQKWKWKRRI